MNAKEFAHELEKAASFIRQQQAEIEALKAGKIRAYNNGVEDGRKPDTNNKPVAWIKKKEIGYMEVTKKCGAKDYATNLGLVPEDDDIPLYTHPVKEQEIKEAKYGITTKWDGITTYHETTEPIGKAQEKC